MADEFSRPLQIPGLDFPIMYDTRVPWKEFVKAYNQTRPESAPEIREGAPIGLRLALSGAPDAAVEATLKKKFPWSDTVFTDLAGAKNLSTRAQEMAANKHRLYYDPEEGAIFTLDEPGFSIGDVADAARPAANIAAELLANFAPLGKGGQGTVWAVKELLKRAGVTAGAGTGADVVYQLAAETFGDLEDPRTPMEHLVDAGEDFLLRAAFEFGGGAASGGLRTGAKAHARGYAPRRQVEDRLNEYYDSFKAPPASLGFLTGKGSRIQIVENKITQLYPDVGKSLQNAIEGTEAAIRGRLDDVMLDVSPGVTPTPQSMGDVLHRGIEGERVPFGRARARTGGWREVHRVNKRRAWSRFEEVFPTDTPVDVTPLARAYQEVKDLGVSNADLSAVESVLTVKNPTARHLYALQDELGPRTKMGEDKETFAHLYDAAKSALKESHLKVDEGRVLSGGVPKAVELGEMYDRISEWGYVQYEQYLNKILKTGGRYKTSAEASTALWTAFNRGDGETIGAFLTKLEPDDADFVRRGLLEKFFDPNARSLEKSLRRWRSMPKETRDLVAPIGSSWRRDIDAIADSTIGMGLIDRASGSASTLAQAERGLFQQAERKAASSTGPRRTVTGLLGVAGLGGLATATAGGKIGIGTALAGAGVSGLVLASSFVEEVAKRLAIKKQAKILQNPAFFHWVASVTQQLPERGMSLGTADRALDFAVTIMPKIEAEWKVDSLQDMEDMKILQETYLEILNENVAGGQ